MVNHPDLSRSRMGQAGLNILRGCFPKLLNLLSTQLKSFFVHFLKVIHLFDVFSRCFSFKVEVGCDIIRAAVLNVAKHMQQILVDLLLVI
jgi:hypothetical protein